MTGVLVDSNVLLDVMTGDPKWSAWSSDALARCADTSVLVINPVIYAEVSIRFAAPLPDFFIGAHAAVEKLDLLTRDDSRYRAYFSTVRLIAPGR